jgi:hypothetical protein
MGFWDDERGSLQAAAEPQKPASWRTFVSWLTRSSATCGMRDMCGTLLIGMGLIRVIDGRLFTTPQSDYAPTWFWGLIELAVGIGLLLTRVCYVRVSRRGRLAASIAAGFCVALAFAMFPTSAMAAYVHLIIAYACVLEAQVHGCK